MGLIHYALDRGETFKDFTQDNLKVYSKWLIALITIVLKKKIHNHSWINWKFIRALANSYKKQYENLAQTDAMNQADYVFPPPFVNSVSYLLEPPAILNNIDRR